MHVKVISIAIAESQLIQAILLEVAVALKSPCTRSAAHREGASQSPGTVGREWPELRHP